MEITIVDEKGNRYDPTIRQITEEYDHFLFVVEYANPSPFSPGDRAQLVLASDTYQEEATISSDFVKRRAELTTVVGTCRKNLSDKIAIWITNETNPVTDVLAADNMRIEP